MGSRVTRADTGGIRGVDVRPDAVPFWESARSRIAEYEERTKETIYSPAMLRHFAQAEYGGIELEDRLKNVTQPVLVCTGRLDRACIVEAAEAIANGLPNAALVIFENSGHMTFVEEPDLYLKVVRDFLNQHMG